jgi:hypothetical protein
VNTFATTTVDDLTVPVTLARLDRPTQWQTSAITASNVDQFCMA